MKFVDAIFSCPIFIEVAVDMVQAFWYCYHLTFSALDDFGTQASMSLGLVQSLILLTMVMLSAAFTNEASKLAKDVIVSLPSFYPNYEKELKICIGQRFTQDVDLSLWKIYRIDKPLFISTLGTLLTYGVLLGTLGSVQTSTNDTPCSHAYFLGMLQRLILPATVLLAAAHIHEASNLAIDMIVSLPSFSPSRVKKLIVYITAVKYVQFTYKENPRLIPYPGDTSSNCTRILLV
ncbi:hypothetical protein HNY73_015072 [Argiope bruennichi]|uniref:Uncharacterized protein n=1 Tax=Argiope bruennichi TaxID=94029 RepID=A0A8T0ESI0_ARGBR|nr:hypothetical protein HNY73_015072 [Argiope bruennichi]